MSRTIRNANSGGGSFRAKGWAATAVWLSTALLLPFSGATALAVQSGDKDVPDGPVPVVEDAEVGAGAGLVEFAASNDGPALAPGHPPISEIPPVPMPDDTGYQPESTSGPGAGVFYDAGTGAIIESATMDFEALSGGSASGGGYSGPDGGGGLEGDDLPAMMNGSMSLISTASRKNHPWRMNAKVVLAWDTNGTSGIQNSDSFGVCSGTMRDAETVLTAGHCVFDFGGNGWADAAWIYPGWDGVGGQFNIPPTIINPYGFGRATQFASWTGWTQNGDWNYDVGLIAVDRAVGMLTGWFGWSHGGSCSWHTSATYNNASYPAQNCPTTGLHNGSDMYYWSGTFDSCPSFNRLQLNTVPGCLNAIWGGQSGSGAYYIDGGNRYVHAITSTSNRSTNARFARQFESWVNYSNNTFIPTYARGSAFDLQGLDVNVSPTTIKAGAATSTLSHLGTNPTNGTKNGTFTVRFYLSTNDNISTADTLLSTRTYSWNYGTMSSVTVNHSPLTIPANTPPGTYYLGLIYDGGTDGNSSNNDTDGWDAAKITVTKPDLDIISISAPASAQPGDSITVFNSVKNIGNASSGSFRLGIYFSTNSTCSTADSLLTFRSVSLGPGSTSSANTSVIVPGSAALGTRYICAIADYLSQVAESNESNNTGFDAIQIVQSDLRITLLNAPASASPGGAIVVPNQVVNSGTGAAGSFRVGLYLSSDTVCTTSDTFLTSRLLSSLAAGSSHAHNTSVTIPAATALGDYYVCAIADYLGSVAESSETNNTLSDPTSILPATPAVTLKVNGQHPTPPSVPTPGPVKLTLSVGATTYTGSLDWYWAQIHNGKVVWFTKSGPSSTPAPAHTGPPVVLSDVVLIDQTYPPGTVLTNYIFLVKGTTLVAMDYITARVTGSTGTE